MYLINIGILILESYRIAGTEIKEVQRGMLDIMIKVDHIARKNDIKYVLAAGTLLGCIRHQGFIPWDDDLDIALLRRDYNKLRKACKNELESNLFWQDNKSENKYPLDFAKVKNLNTIYIERDYSSLDINHGIFIDIFPMDNTFPKFNQLQCLVVTALQRLKWEKLGVHLTPKHWYEKVLKLPIIKKVLWIFQSEILNLLIDFFSQIFNIFPTKFVNIISHGGIHIPVYNRTDFCDVIEGDFENQKFLIPKEFHKYLTRRFGDYMKLPPEDKRQPTHNIIKCNIHQE